MVALDGDNVVRRSIRMKWFEGPTVLEYLESVPIENNRHSAPFRMPVQYVIRADGTRGYAGQIVSGSVAVGEEILALPSGKRARVERIPSYSEDLQLALAPMSTSICLDDHLDVGRGDMLVDAENPPKTARAFRAKLVWMSEMPLATSRPYLIKHTSQTVCANIVEVVSKLDVSKLTESHPNNWH